MENTIHRESTYKNSYFVDKVVYTKKMHNNFYTNFWCAESVLY